jgi:hypothetical protein
VLDVAQISRQFLAYFVVDDIFIVFQYLDFEVLVNLRHLNQQTYQQPSAVFEPARQAQYPLSREACLPSEVAVQALWEQDAPKLPSPRP